jgi:hypothetical protein
MKTGLLLCYVKWKKESYISPFSEDLLKEEYNYLQSFNIKDDDFPSTFDEYFRIKRKQHMEMVDGTYDGPVLYSVPVVYKDDKHLEEIKKQKEKEIERFIKWL